MLELSVKLMTFISAICMLSIISLLILRKKKLAGRAVISLLISGFIMVSLGDIDAHRKGFTDMSDMQAAQNAGVSDPHRWRVVSADMARVAAVKKAAAEAEQQATKAREAEAAARPAAPSFNTAFANSLAPGSTGLHINSNITPVADISHECNSFRESAQNAQDQADRMRDPDLRRSWESNRDMAQNSYRALCQ